MLPRCHPDQEASFDVIHTIGKSLKTKDKHDSNKGIGNYPMLRIALWHKRLSFLAKVNKATSAKPEN
jgi:hypothetical protein